MVVKEQVVEGGDVLGEEVVEGGDASWEVLFTLPDGGGTLRKRVIRQGNYQPSPSPGEGCVITYKEKSGGRLNNTDDDDDDATSFAIVHDRVRVLLASSAAVSSVAAASATPLHSAATATAPDTLTLEPPTPDLPGRPPNFACPPRHLDVLLGSMRPFERCAFTLSSSQPPPPPPSTTTTITTDTTNTDNTNTDTDTDTNTAAGEVELHCVLGGVCHLASVSTGGSGDVDTGAIHDTGGGGGGSGSTSGAREGGGREGGRGGVTVRVVSRSAGVSEDRYPSRVNADSRVRLMVMEAPGEGCCGGGGGGGGGGVGDEAAAAAAVGKRSASSLTSGTGP